MKLPGVCPPGNYTSYDRNKDTVAYGAKYHSKNKEKTVTTIYKKPLSLWLSCVHKLPFQILIIYQTSFT